MTMSMPMSMSMTMTMTVTMAMTLPFPLTLTIVITNTLTIDVMITVTSTIPSTITNTITNTNTITITSANTSTHTSTRTGTRTKTMTMKITILTTITLTITKCSPSASALRSCPYDAPRPPCIPSWLAAETSGLRLQVPLRGLRREAHDSQVAPIEVVLEVDAASAKRPGLANRSSTEVAGVKLVGMAPRQLGVLLAGGVTSAGSSSNDGADACTRAQNTHTHIEAKARKTHNAAVPDTGSDWSRRKVRRSSTR